LVEASLCHHLQPSLVGDRAKCSEEAGLSALVAEARRRDHVQLALPHLVATVEAEAFTLGEEMLRGFEEDHPHSCRR